MEKELIYFRSERDLQYSMPDQIVLDDWQVHIADSTETLKQTLAEHDIQVGLGAVSASDSDTEIVSCISEAMEQPMNWVALVAPPYLENISVRQAITNHFMDYHTLPLDNERLRVSLGHAFGMANLTRSCQALQPVSDEEEQMVGTSPVMQDIFKRIRKCASVDAPVLVTGESGTGKELAAKAIHERSERKHGPLITVNCAALPATLIQSELFGHEKGAYTGAHKQKIGRIEAAHTGTIFLDEIGDLPMDLQVNLLRFIQERTIERVGSTESIPIDVRIIAATHVNLEKAIAEGRFREDLYYRLNVLQLKMPPLRERGEDVELLARYFFQKWAPDGKGSVKGFKDSTLRLLRNQQWSGNVRELINRVRRAIVMCEGGYISPEDLGLERRISNDRLVMTLQEARENAEKQVVISSLKSVRNNVSQAAKLLDVSRVTLYRMIEKYGIPLHE